MQQYVQQRPKGFGAKSLVIRDGETTLTVKDHAALSSSIQEEMPLLSEEIMVGFRFFRRDPAFSGTRFVSGVI